GGGAQAGRQPAGRLPTHRVPRGRRRVLGARARRDRRPCAGRDRRRRAPVSPIVLWAAAYVVGSIPFGMLVARAKGVNLRTVGSGNIGATNVARALGKGWAVVVLLADAAKGFGPVALGRHLGLPPRDVALAGLCAIVGHMFTIFLRGRGGKGVATSLGVAFALSWPAALCGFGLYVLAYAVSRLSSVGSLLGIWSFPVFGTLLGPLPRPYLYLSIVVAMLVTIPHRHNITRLVRGAEKKA